MMRGFLFILFVLATPATAQAQLMGNDLSKPVEITAQGSIEWDQKNSLYSARGGAVARQGDVTIEAVDLTGHYEGDQSNLSRLEATGNVVLSQGVRVIKGDKAVYDLKTGVANLTGGGLTLTTPDMLLTARDAFRYDVNKKTFEARGAAKAVQSALGRTVTADILTARFTKDNELSDILATGDVTIIAGEDKVSGEKAVYDALHKKAEVSGQTVTLTRGPNILTGMRASVDLATNISTLHGAGADQPARAVFYPEATKAATP